MEVHYYVKIAFCLIQRRGAADRCTFPSSTQIIIWIKINIECCVIAGTSFINAHKTYWRVRCISFGALIQTFCNSVFIAENKTHSNEFRHLTSQ